MLQEAPNIHISSSTRLDEPQIAPTESPLEGTDISSQVTCIFGYFNDS